MAQKAKQTTPVKAAKAAKKIKTEIPGRITRKPGKSSTGGAAGRKW